MHNIGALRLLRHVPDPVRLLDRLAREGQSVSRLRVPGRRAVYLVGEPSLVAHVWSGSRNTYLRTGLMWDQMQKLQGRQGIGQEGPDWQPSRKMLQPILSPAAIRRLHSEVAVGVRLAVDDLVQRAKDARKPLPLVPAMKSITHSVLGRAFFGSRLPAESVCQVGEAIDSSFQAMLPRIVFPGVPEWVPMPGDRRHREAVTQADRIVYPAVTSSREEQQTDDVISRLAHATTDSTLARNNVVALIIGGTETTALTLAWALIALDRHPEAATRLKQEVEDVVGGPGGEVLPDHMADLQYTGMVLDEVLRLYPPGWMLPRHVAREDMLGDIAVRPGDTVIVSPYLTHRLPDLWPDPQRFDPDRWAAGTAHSDMAYYPFGGGIHLCIGKYLFRVEALLALAALHSAFRITVRAPRGLRLRGSLALQPRYPVYVELNVRTTGTHQRKT